MYLSCGLIIYICDWPELDQLWKSKLVKHSESRTALQCTAGS